MSVSIADAVSQAVTRTVLVTFKPFDLGKWFVLGFVAFLATLGLGGFNFPYSQFTWHNVPSFENNPLAPLAHPAMALVVVFAASAVVIVIVLGLLVAWIKSRAAFMFIDDVVRNSNSELVVRPWKEFRSQGNSLFGFMVIFTLVSMAIFAFVAGGCALIALPDIQTQTPSIFTLIAVLAGCLLMVPIWLVLILIYLCTFNFVVPIMYLRRQGVLAGWREFRTAIVPGHVGALVLFFLLKLALYIATGAIAMFAGCMTCCIGFLPYLGTVVTLPLYVFHRCYSLCFLQQFGPGYQFFTDTPPAEPTSPQLPPLPPSPAV